MATMDQTWKMDLPLGSPEILLTPLWSTILVARSKFLPNMKCKLGLRANDSNTSECPLFKKMNAKKNQRRNSLTSKDDRRSLQPTQFDSNHQIQRPKWINNQYALSASQLNRFWREKIERERERGERHLNVLTQFPSTLPLPPNCWCSFSRSILWVWTVILRKMKYGLICGFERAYQSRMDVTLGARFQLNGVHEDKLRLSVWSNAQMSKGTTNLLHSKFVE